MLVRPAHRLPVQPELTTILEGLVGKDVTFARVEHVDVPRFVAVYVNSNDRPVNTVSVDLALAVSMSAALALVPLATAEEWIASGTLDEESTDNVYEVLNVLAAAHNNGADHDRHVRIERVAAPGEDLGNVVSAGLAEPVLQRTFRVDIEGYPGGTMHVAAF